MKSLVLALLSISAVLPVFAADLRQAEETVTHQCSRCHGLGGESVDPFFPRLTGQYQEYLERQLQDFKSGKRKSDVMIHQVGGLSTEEMRLISVFLEAGFSTNTETGSNPDRHIRLPALSAGKLQANNAASTKKKSSSNSDTNKK